MVRCTTFPFSRGNFATVTPIDHFTRFFMDTIWNYHIGNNPVRDIAIALGIIVLSMAALRLVQNLVIRSLKKLTSRTKTTIDDFLVQVLQSSVMPLLYSLSVYAGLQYLTLSANVQQVLHLAVLVVTTVFLLRIINAFISYAFKRAMARRDTTHQQEKQSKGILLIVQVLVWLVGILFLVDNLGYDITTLVAGLGIGGIAIALAAQTILGDLFSYLVIFFDKPFEVGDFIILDDKMGTVEYVGIKTTRIRTLGGEQLVCSNTDLTNSRVHNYKRMQERRVVFSFGVVYNTPSRQLNAIPGMVKEIITGMENTRFDRAHFKAFGNFSLDFEVVYYVLLPDYNTYMDIQQQINLDLFSLFANDGIEFAFPTQTLHLAGLDKTEKELPSLNGVS